MKPAHLPYLQQTSIRDSGYWQKKRPNPINVSVCTAPGYLKNIRDSSKASTKDSPFQIIRLPLQNNKTDQKDRPNQRNHPKAIKMQSHRFLKRPSDEDNHWSYQETDLNCRSYGDADREIHLIFGGNYHGSHVLGKVSCNWNDDESHERFAEDPLFVENGEA